jgi:xylulokinase
MNRLWLQAVSDCSSCPQDLAVQTVGASFGSALLAGVGAGILTLRSIREANPVGDRIVPDISTKALYDQQHHVFLSLYINTKDLLPRLPESPAQ